MSNVEKAAKEKQLGNEAYRKKDFPAAHKHYDAAIELDPTNITYLTNKAAVYFEEGKLDECIALCEKSVDIGRENHADYNLIAKAYARMGNAYAKQDKTKEAIQYFDKSLSEHRDPEILKKRNELDKKLKESQRLAYVNPDVSLEEKNKGNELYQKGDYPGAMRHYNEAIKRNPEDAKLYSNRAACYAKLMEFRYAVEDCDRCIRIDPKFVKAYIRKGLALKALNDMPRATKAFEDALKLDPNNKEALDGLRSATFAADSDPDKTRKRAMEDPEIQAILGDPAMRLILEQMTQDPKAVREHLGNPEIAQKIMKLIDAGVVGMR